MKGLMRRAAALLVGAAAAAGGPGCNLWRDCVDPCYPQRYEAMARQEVCAAFAPQILNGHVLDQTVWNYEFERDREGRAVVLTPGALEHLAYLARRRPTPDPVVYLQTAQDVAYDPAAPEKMVAARDELNQLRTQAVYRFLNAQTAGSGVAFQVVVHDPADPGLPGSFVGSTMLQLPGRARAGLPGGGGASATGGGGAPTGGGGGSSTGR
jgi:hypothetical protein